MFNTYTNNEIAYNVNRPMRDHMLDPMTPELGRMLSFYLCSSQLTFPGVYLSICLLTANTTQPGQPSVTRPLLLSYYITLLLPFPSLPMLWYRWQNPVQVQQLENLVVQCTLLQPTMVYLFQKVTQNVCARMIEKRYFRFIRFLTLSILWHVLKKIQ